MVRKATQKLIVISVLCIGLPANCLAFDPLMLEKAQALGECENCDFTKATLKGIDLKQVTLNASDFTDADLSGAQIGKCDECNFTGAKLISAKCSDAYMHHSVLNRADLTNADMKKVTLTKGSFTGATIINTNFVGAKLDKADFKGVIMKGSNFSFADLSHSDLRSTNLEGAKFRGALLKRTKLSGSMLKNADFTGTDLSETLFSKGSIYDSTANSLVEIIEPIKCVELQKAGAIFDSTTKCAE